MHIAHIFTFPTLAIGLLIRAMLATLHIRLNFLKSQDSVLYSQPCDQPCWCIPSPLRRLGPAQEHVPCTHLTMLQSVGYGGGGVQWEVDGMESGGGRAWVGLSPFMSPAIGM